MTEQQQDPGDALVIVATAEAEVIKAADIEAARKRAEQNQENQR